MRPIVSKLRRFVVGSLAVAGAMALLYVGFVHSTTSEAVKDTVSGVAKSIEHATMQPGTYTVQLEYLELRDEDWSHNAIVGGPKPVYLRVSSNGRTLFQQDVGAFRGKKTFMEHPLAWNVDYDGKSPITLELAEAEVLSEGKRYQIQDPWPFTHTTLAGASRMSFTWKRAADARQ